MRSTRARLSPFRGRSCAAPAFPITSSRTTASCSRQTGGLTTRPGVTMSDTPPTGFSVPRSAGLVLALFARPVRRARRSASPPLRRRSPGQPPGRERAHPAHRHRRAGQRDLVTTAATDPRASGLPRRQHSSRSGQRPRGHRTASATIPPATAAISPSTPAARLAAGRGRISKQKRSSSPRPRAPSALCAAGIPSSR